MIELSRLYIVIVSGVISFAIGHIFWAKEISNTIELLYASKEFRMMLLYSSSDETLDSNR